MTETKTRSISAASKLALRKLIPDFVLKQRDIIRRLGPRAGRIYSRLWLLDALGMRTANHRLVPASARSFLFVCFGNIMRSAMAESLMKRMLSEAGISERVCIVSAGLHARTGCEAHTWAQEASRDLGISLEGHRAKFLAREMVEQADCIFAMDFQNKAELLALYPESRGKIYMLSAYAEGCSQYREIPDPYFEGLESTRLCGRQLQTCIRNLITALFPSSCNTLNDGENFDSLKGESLPAMPSPGTGNK